MGRARCAKLFTLAGLGGLWTSVAVAQSLQPTYLGTEGLEAAQVEIRALAERGAWPLLGRGPTLRPGDRHQRVALLRARLAATTSVPDPLLFDAELEIAVRAFQRSHGLEPDAQVGPATRAELDRTPLDRLRQIERVIASRRAMPADLGDRFLLVNLPALELEAIEAGRPDLRLRVVVGSADRQTPTLDSEVIGLIVHPIWNVPARIAREEIAPRAARDPGYLERLGFEVLRGGASEERIDPGSVDWSAFARGELDLDLRQRPGPLNALGTVTFQFQNPFNVCLHDTPERQLFERARRAASHGCIRVEQVFDLARWLMRNAPEDAAKRFEEVLDGSVTESLRLPAPVPIYIVDWPVWVDADGVLQMRPELYPPDLQPEGAP